MYFRALAGAVPDEASLCRFRNHLVVRAYKNKLLSTWQKLANKQTHQQKVLNIVEWCFGTAKRLSRIKYASYFSTIKIDTQVICIGMNLKNRQEIFY